LEGVTGDWQCTTDSSCLSKKSIAIENAIASFRTEDKTDVLQELYTLPEEVSKIAYKYRHDFPKLVAKLERKYADGSFPDISSFAGGGDSSGRATRNEL
jgi:hypothetical protein